MTTDKKTQKSVFLLRPTAVITCDLSDFPSCFDFHNLTKAAIFVGCSSSDADADFWN